jgi:hypothetical protein
VGPANRSILKDLGDSTALQKIFFKNSQEALKLNSLKQHIIELFSTLPQAEHEGIFYSFIHASIH